MVNSGQPPQEPPTFQWDDLLGKLRSRKFAVEVVHGDFSPGAGHSLKLFLTEEGKQDAHFQLLGEKHPVALSAITGLKLSTEKRGFHLFAYRSWERALIPIGVLCCSTFFAKTHWAINIAATLCSAVLSTSLGKNTRFLCDLKDGRYFTAIMPAVGYKVLKGLVESENRR